MKEHNPLRYEWRDFIPLGKGLERYLKRNEEKVRELDEECLVKVRKLAVYQSLIFAGAFTGVAFGLGYTVSSALEELLK